MKFILATIVIIGLLLSFTLYQYGLFTPINFVEKNSNKLILVYEKHTGSYKDVGEKMEKIALQLAADSIPFSKRFGIYYDNPREVAETDLRSLVGCVINQVDSATLSQLGEKYDLAEYKAVPSVIAQFPFKGNLSILFGILKVYPSLTDFLNEKEYSHGPIMELYDHTNKTISYITPQKADKIFYDALLGLYEL